MVDRSHGYEAAAAEFMKVRSPSIAEALVPGGRLLFTSSAHTAFGTDVLTGLASRSRGADEYRQRLAAVGISVVHEYVDEGGNHYFDAVKGPAAHGPGSATTR